MDFPQYRKYKNIETYFKIISEKKFEEIVIMGSKTIKHTIVAKQYPEILRIHDMLNCEGDAWEVVNKEIYDNINNRN